MEPTFEKVSDTTFKKIVPRPSYEEVIDVAVLKRRRLELQRQINSFVASKQIEIDEIDADLAEAEAVGVDITVEAKPISEDMSAG